MNVTLTVSGIIFTFLDEEVDSVRSRTTQSPDNVTITGTGAMGSYLFNYEGATKTIIVSGRLLTASTTRTSIGTVKTIAAQKKWIEGIFAGQSNAVTFSSDFEDETPDVVTGFALPYVMHYATTTVIGGAIDFEQIAGEINELPFTMTLVVGGI